MMPVLKACSWLIKFRFLLRNDLSLCLRTQSQFSVVLEENTTIQMILNPRSKEMAEKVGLMLKLIEKQRDDVF